MQPVLIAVTDDQLGSFFEFESWRTLDEFYWIDDKASASSIHVYKACYEIRKK